MKSIEEKLVFVDVSLGPPLLFLAPHGVECSAERKEEWARFIKIKLI